MEIVESYDIEICDNCAQLLANGDIGDHGKGYPGMDGAADGDHVYNRPGDDEDDNPSRRHAALMDKVWPWADGWHLFLDDSDGSDNFSTASCEGCGTHLGGNRNPAYALRQG